MLEVTEEIRRHRDQWTYRGDRRPPFALAPAAGQESVWDYPRPPRIMQDEREILVVWKGRRLASSRTSVRVLETAGAPTFYLPRHHVEMQILLENDTQSLCEWKGSARSFNVVDGPRDAAWSYIETFPEYAELAGWMAFYPGRVECYVDGERARPQAGGYYGGWVTSEIVGPVKGDPMCEGL